MTDRIIHREWRVQGIGTLSLQEGGKLDYQAGKLIDAYNKDLDCPIGVNITNSSDPFHFGEGDSDPSLVHLELHTTEYVANPDTNREFMCHVKIRLDMHAIQELRDFLDFILNHHDSTLA